MKKNYKYKLALFEVRVGREPFQVGAPFQVGKLFSTSSWRSFQVQVDGLFKSTHLFKECAQYDSAHIFQVQVNPLFRVSAPFQSGVGHAICEEGVLLKLEFFEQIFFLE